MSVLFTAMITVSGDDYRSGRTMETVKHVFTSTLHCEGYADRFHSGNDVRMADGKRVSTTRVRINNQTSNVTEIVTFCYEY